MPKGKHLAVPNAAGDWTAEETAALLENALSGRVTFESLAHSLGRSVDSVRTRVWKVLTNYRDGGEVPHDFKLRVDRTGTRCLTYERKCINRAIRLGVPLSYLSRVVGRSDGELWSMSLELATDGHPPSRPSGFGV